MPPVRCAAPVLLVATLLLVGADLARTREPRRVCRTAALRAPGTDTVPEESVAGTSAEPNAGTATRRPDAATTDGYRIRGRVVDERGAPVAGARVQCTSDWPIAWWQRGFTFSSALDRRMSPCFEEQSAADGSFTIEGRGLFTIEGLDPSAEFHVVACKPGFADGAARTFAGNESVVVRLERLATVAGQVLHEDGRPAPGARVGNTGADADGRFRVCVPPGPLDLTAQDGTRRGVADLDLAPGETREGVRLVIHEVPRSLIRVRILRPDGTPLANHDVYVGDGTFSLRKTDAEGRLACALEVPAGSDVEIRFADDDLHRRLEARTLPLGSEAEVVFPLPAPIRATVLVRDRNGAAIGNASVYVEHAHAADGTHEGEGRFVFELVAATETGCRVEAEGYGTAYVEGWTPVPGEMREVRLDPERRVTGRVLDASGRPATHVLVQWEVDAGGRFEASVDPDATTLPVRQHVPVFPDIVLLRIPVDAIPPGATRDVGDIVLPRCGRVTGLVTDGAGTPAGGVLIAVLRRGLGQQGHAVTKADGRFAIVVPCGERVRVVAWKRDCGSAISDPVSVPARLRLGLAPSPRVLCGSVFEATTVDGFRLPWQWTVEYTVRGLPPGPLCFHLRDEHGREDVRHVDLAPGARVTLD